MFKFFRRKRDDKTLACNAEQEISTIKKLDMAKEAMEKLEAAKDLISKVVDTPIERRYRVLPVEFERRRA